MSKSSPHTRSPQAAERGHTLHSHGGPTACCPSHCQVPWVAGLLSVLASQSYEYKARSISLSLSWLHHIQDQQLSHGFNLFLPGQLAKSFSLPRSLEIRQCGPVAWHPQHSRLPLSPASKPSLPQCGPGRPAAGAAGGSGSAGAQWPASASSLAGHQSSALWPALQPLG